MEYEIQKYKKEPWKIILPKGIDKYLHKCTNHPIVYDRHKKKAFCFACGEYFHYGKRTDGRVVYSVEPFRADDLIVCPMCAHKGRAVPHTRNVFVSNCAVTGRKNGENIYITIIEGLYKYETSAFEDQKKTKGKVHVIEAIKIGRREQVSYLRWGDTWEKMLSVYVRKEISQVRPIVHQSLANAVKQSFLQYTGIEVMANSRPYLNEIIKRLAVNAKYPQLEYLKKAGIKEIEDSLVWGYPTYIRPNWKKKDLPGVLGITSQDIDKLRQWKMFDITHIAAYKEIKKAHKKIRRKDMEDYFSFFEDIGPFKYTSPYRKSIEGLDPLKTARYLEKMYLENKPCCGHGYYAYSRGYVLSEYRDYINQLEMLEYPETDYYLFPKSFQEAHKKISKEYREKQDWVEQRRKRCEQDRYEQKYLPELLKLSWKDGTYFIRPLVDYADFSAEGRANCNCVASYYDRATEGKTSVFVIRKLSAPEESLATVEIRDKKMVQCRGKGNREPDPEVKAFADKWMQEVVLKKKKKGAAAPAA